MKPEILEPYYRNAHSDVCLYCPFHIVPEWCYIAPIVIASLWYWSDFHGALPRGPIGPICHMHTPHLFNAVTALAMGRHYPVFFLKTYTLFAQCISCVSVYEFEPLTLGLVLNLSVFLSIRHQRRSERQREGNLSMEHYVNHDSLTSNMLRRMHPFF